MVVMSGSAMLALAATVSAMSDKPKRCRATLNAAVERIERRHVHGPKNADGANAIRTACFACARCPGI